MKGLRIIKKSRQLFRSVESQSREIITSIFANGIETEQLELSLKDWTSEHAIPTKAVLNPIVIIEQPLKNLLQLLQHLSKDFYIQVCSFIFLNKDNLYIVLKDKYVTIKKVRNEKSKLKYWLSHIYFSRLRDKLQESLLQQNFNVEREVIHFNEEKQYMPSLVSGGKHPSTTLIRQMKVSRSSIDRKKGESQRQEFCVGYFKNGTEQIFSYSEILSFVEYPFNLSQISYFKILEKQNDKNGVIATLYFKAQKTLEQQILLEKLKRLLKKQERWKLLKDEFEEMKNTFIKNSQFQLYCRLLMFEIISFLEVKVFVEVRELKLQWTIDSKGNAILSNAALYKFAQINKATEVTEGLITLYEKCQSIRYKNKSQDQQGHFGRFKKIRSEQKYKTEGSTKLPLLHQRHKSKQKEMIRGLKIKNKANSCVLRLGISRVH